jgi:AmmeMemoRadiSam system protein B
MGERRRAAVAGSWYPGTREELAAAVDLQLARARPAPAPGRLVALISPHAGLVYSGPVAAWGYALLGPGTPSSVVLVGPSHRPDFAGAAVFARGVWETPLGAVPVDEELAAALLERGTPFALRPDAHAREHSLEMQLPFLQRRVADLRIVPVLMGAQDRSAVDRLADGLTRALAGRAALLVASSDLSHYLSSDAAARADAVVVDRVERFDPEGLMSVLERDPGHACGGGPMVAVMRAARALGAGTARILRYADSGEESGDRSRVVGYLSAALLAVA